jgi:excisionase family DNA binding protein
MTETPQKRYYRPDEVAAILRISIASVYRRISDGTLPAIQIGAVYRIPREAIEGLTRLDLQ